MLILVSIILLISMCVFLIIWLIGVTYLWSLDSCHLDKVYKTLRSVREKCDKNLVCKCCGRPYNFIDRYDFNFCSEQCDEECEL